MNFNYCNQITIAFLLFLCCFLPSETKGQDVRITLNHNDVPIKTILEDIEKQIEKTFFFEDYLINLQEKTSISIKNADLKSVIERLFDKKITYLLVDKHIVLQKVGVEASSTTVTEMGTTATAATGTTTTGTTVLPTSGNAPYTPGVQTVSRTIYTVHGRVADEMGVPLVGATVMVKGNTKKITITDDDGRFELSDIDPNATLVISFIGYETIEILTAGSGELRVKMISSVTALQNVIVTGYSVIDRGSSTGATYTPDLPQVLMPNMPNIAEMLQGHVPGMLVTIQSGQVGATPKIRIRGTSTLLGNQEPLWVVDGVIQRDPLPQPPGRDISAAQSDLFEMRELASNAISWLNPLDIEVLTVLKDASATAIYGAQASNGVIVITTKKGTAGRIAVSYSANIAVGQRPTYGMYDLMNSQELMQFSKEMYEGRDSYTRLLLPIGYGGLVQQLQNKEIDYDTYIREFRKLENENTDWFGQLFRNTFNHSHNISISGGSDRVVNRTSFSLTENYGEARGNTQTTMTTNSNTTFRLGDRLTLNLSLSGSLNRTDGFAYGVSPFDYAKNTSRTIPMYNEDGTLFYHAKSPVPNPGRSNVFNGTTYYLYNIQNEIDNTGYTNKTQTLRSNIDLNLKLTKGLQFQSLFSYSLSGSNVRSYATELSHYITSVRGYEFGTVLPGSVTERSSYLPHGGLIQLENAMSSSWTFRNSLVYNERFKDKHTVTLQFGVELRSSLMDGNRSTQYGYLRYRGETFAPVPETYLPTNGVAAVNPLHASMRTFARITNTVNNYFSEYFTAVYNYDGRYVLSCSARLDASNRFGQDQNKRFEPNWSAGVKWRLGNENFMSFLTDLEWLDLIDFSFAYGYTGNAVESVSPYLIATDGGLSAAFNQYTLNIQSLPYPDLGWEKTNTWNAGLDFSFFRGRLSAVVNWYRSVNDVLARKEVPVENGMVTAVVMGTKMENRGYDLIVNVIPVRTKDITWMLSFNTGLARNKITDNKTEYTRSDYLNGNAYTVEGQPYGTFYSYAYAGLDGNGFPTFNLMDINLTNNPLDFLVVSGTTEPNLFGGINTMFRYKNITLRGTFSMAFGAQKRLPNLYPETTGAPGPDSNIPRILNNRWKNPGDENIPGIYPGIPGAPYRLDQYLPLVNRASVNRYEMYNYSDERVANADFIRCRQLSLAYDLPSVVLNAIGVRRATLSLSMANPFLIAFDKDWLGYDPETGGWPARRTTSFSINISL